jgi:hypothetical protein
MSSRVDPHSVENFFDICLIVLEREHEERLHIEMHKMTSPLRDYFMQII